MRLADASLDRLADDSHYWAARHFLDEEFEGILYALVVIYKAVQLSLQRLARVGQRYLDNCCRLFVRLPFPTVFNRRCVNFVRTGLAGRAAANLVPALARVWLIELS